MQEYAGGVLIPPNEVARLLGVSGETLRLWRRDGKFIDPVDLPRRPRWRLSDVLELKASRNASKRSAEPADPAPAEPFLDGGDIAQIAKWGVLS
jgi:predicted DNA-binding transcriptional regulator AlpA